MLSFRRSSVSDENGLFHVGAETERGVFFFATFFFFDITSPSCRLAKAEI